MSRRLSKEVELHTTVWQPDPALVDTMDSHLLANSNGIVMLTDGQKDVEPSLERLKAILRHLPKDLPFPKIIVLAASQEDDSKQFAGMIQKVISDIGFFDVPMPEVIQAAPYLDQLFDEISRNVQKDWVSYFVRQGRKVELPELKWGPSSEDLDPCIHALRRISEAGNAAVSKRHRLETMSDTAVQRKRERDMQNWAQWLQEGREKRGRLPPEPEGINPELSRLIDKVWKYPVPQLPSNREEIPKLRHDAESNEGKSEKEMEEIFSLGELEYNTMLKDEFLSATLEEKSAFLKRKNDQIWKTWSNNLKSVWQTGQSRRQGVWCP